MLRFFTFTLLFLSFSILAAFPGKVADRFVIAQFSTSFEKKVLEEVTGYAFALVEPLNTGKTLYRLGYDSNTMNEASVSAILRKLPDFMSYERDEPIELRKTMPNDTLFGKQWHHNLIRSTEAWDLTRSGVNRRGDTIVIAVIDDGLHVNHPDFRGNIWINYADSAGNGIDDDSNGYIDDHYGWNFMSQNNDISDSLYYKAKHGTPVAAIIGARGNDTTGVTGIMWNVKLMIVNVADSSPVILIYQSDAIRAYSYVLQQRKLYNSTGGRKGAFVVATNSSWGADNKKPHQTPLWCAMYDSLGKYGILNVSAVTNSNQAVDVAGDIPTLCPSEHLVTVASTTASDGHFDCGYSTVSVDLSAPGAGIYTARAYTKQNISAKSLYNDSHSGTSFASPMVAAAIGILHSYACERVLDTIKMNPAKGNLLMRKFILEGVDVKQSLAGKTVTSGRLNIKRSMQVMEAYCAGEVNVATVSKEIGVYLFPNPGNGNIQVLSDMPVTSVECYDITGKQVSCRFTGNEILLGDISGGIYFVKVYMDGMQHTFKYVRSASE
jgi:serine protease